MAILATLTLTNTTTYSIKNIEENAGLKLKALSLGAAGLSLGYLGYRMFGWESNQEQNLFMEARKIEEFALNELRKEHNLSDAEDPSKILNDSILNKNEKLQNAKQLKRRAYRGDLTPSMVPLIMSVFCLLGAWSMFDEAMQRRIDDAIEMPLPKQAERFRTLQSYRDTILRDVKQNEQAFVDSVDLYLTDAKLQEIASQTDGFSYGDLQDIINTLKSEADITDDGLVTSRLIDRVVTFAREKKEAFSVPKKTNQVEQTAPAAYKTLGTILQRAG